MDQSLFEQKIALFRKRFGAREDAFGVKQTYTEIKVDPTTGETSQKESSTIFRHCENFGNQSLCLIAQNKGGCATCTNKVDGKLTDSWIWKHISGQRDLILYLLQEGGIKFGACDFDRGTPFEDALMIKKYSEEILGLPAYIARSSKKGYHLYWFFTEVVPAHLFTSMVRHIYNNTGIYTRNMDNPAEFLIPEVFPKQTNFIAEKYGNGIKVPMIEPKMKVGFNCWVDDEAKPYPMEEQWERLKVCKEVSREQLDSVLTQFRIPLISVPVNRAQPKLKLVEGPNGMQVSAPVDAWKPKKTGDFNQIMLNCPSLSRFWEKASDGTYKFDKTANENGVPHTVRFASLTYALGTANGLEIIQKRWNTEKTKAMIDHAIGSGGYTPASCRWLQDNGVCIRGTHPKVNGTHCFDKKPPQEVENGMIRINPQNLPESEWQEPSPIRLAYKKTKMTLKELEVAFEVLFEKPERDDEHQNQLQALMKAAKRLPLGEQTRLNELLKTRKWITARLLKEVDKVATREVRAEEAADRVSKADGEPLIRGEAKFFVENGGYVRQTINDKGVPSNKILTNFTLRILENLFEFDTAIDKEAAKRGTATKDVWFNVCLTVNNQDKTFHVRGDLFEQSAEKFFAELLRASGSAIWGDRREWNDILYCVNLFSEPTKVIRRQTADIGHTILNKNACYLMPSVIINKDGIFPNREIEVNLNYDEAKKLDFKILSDEEFKDLALHIVNDFFPCNLPIATMATFAHAMAAAILPQLPISKSPLLFLGGDPGNGKSFVGEVGQCFFGDFGDQFASSRSSSKGSHKLSHVFRHALVLSDDFKALIAGSGANGVVDYIQTVYDRSVKHALKRDGEFRSSPPFARGLSVITAQDVPEKEDSAISRLILIRIENQKLMNLAKGNIVKERRKDYCGFTPHFIHYVYGLPQEHITEIFKNYVRVFSILTPAPTDENIEGSPRISENLAMNMTAFHLALECMYSKGVIDPERQESLRRQHETGLNIVRRGLYQYVASQKGVTVFLEVLQDLLQDTARYHIANWPGVPYLEHKNSKPLGVYNPQFPDIFFLYSGSAYSAASEEMRRRNHKLHPQTTIGKQLHSEGHLDSKLIDASDAGCTKQINGPLGYRVRTWAIKLSSLGYQTPAPLTNVTRMNISN